MVTQGGSAARTYRIIELVGRGGFGTVYRAELQGAGGFTKQVAIKVLNDDHQASPEVLQRLRDEARILGLIRHRAVVGVDSLARFDQGWGVVMEYVPGVDLAALLDDGSVPPCVALELVEEVASALHVAFAVPPSADSEPLRLLHRDIKPSNIRVTAQGEVKVLDFGVARADFANREARTSSYMFGSLKYMAIERLEGREGPAADIYALGLVLAELLLGKDLDEPPRQAERYASFLEEVTDGLRAQLRGDPFSSEDDCSAGIIELVLAMLRDDDEGRPSAYQVEHSCRSLRQSLSGPWLRDWAATQVPRLAACVEEAERDPNSGSILVEGPAWGRSDEERAGSSGSGRAGGLAVKLGFLGALAGGAVGLMALGLWFAGTGRWWNVEDQPPPKELATPGTQEPAQAGALSRMDLDQPEHPDELAENAAEESSTKGDEQPGGTLASGTESREAARNGQGGAGDQARQPEKETSESSEAQAEKSAEREEEPDQVQQASVELVGEARNLWLVNDQGRYPVGVVPPGSYAIKAWFDGPDPVNAGTITLLPGDSVTIRCVAAMARCVKKN